MSGAPRLAIGVLAGLVMLLGGAAPAVADPAGPTDYRTEIVSVEPPTSSVEVAILGGDSFVELRAEPTVEVEVVGYQGEPYLRFDGDGRVWQNERSPSRWLNDDRYAEAEVPLEADTAAAPEWIEVASDGRYAWHDHRAHWMNPARPIGAEPGDTILEAVIPMTIDGTPTSVEVRSELLASPSPLAAGLGVVGAVVGGVAALVTWRRRRAESADGWVLAWVAGWAVVAALLGLAAVVGLPGEAAPGPSLWLLPLVAAIALAAATIAVGRRLLAPPLRSLVVPAALALAGFELLAWSWIRRDVVARALVPSVAPAWLDRLVVAGAAAAGLVALVAAALAMAWPEPTTVPRSSPRRAR